MKKFISEMKGLNWTLAGTLLVLITLSGETQKTGILLSISGLAIYAIFAYFS